MSQQVTIEKTNSVMEFQRDPDGQGAQIIKISKNPL